MRLVLRMVLLSPNLREWNLLSKRVSLSCVLFFTWPSDNVDQYQLFADE
jgi:hypothetical protein